MRLFPPRAPVKVRANGEAIDHAAVGDAARSLHVSLFEVAAPSDEAAMNPLAAAVVAAEGKKAGNPRLKHHNGKH